MTNYKVQLYTINFASVFSSSSLHPVVPCKFELQLTDTGGSLGQNQSFHVKCEALAVVQRSWKKHQQLTSVTGNMLAYFKNLLLLLP
jgi:hypothetical protein